MDLLLGAVLGVAFERITKFFQNLFFTFRHWRIAGDYTNYNGVVSIRRGFGNRFLTENREPDPYYNWSGSFQFDDTYMRVGKGAYRYVDHERQNDWAYHYIMLLENGDISVQW